MQSNFFYSWKLPPTWSRFLMIALLLLGIFFRFANLDRKIYWHDEVYTSLRISGYTEAELIQLADGNEIRPEDLHKYQRLNPEKGLVDTISGLAREEPQLTPLYYVLVRFWAQWFGDSVAVVRSFSAIVSLLAFPCLYWLCLELFQSSLTGWVAIALMAVSPFHVLYAQEARHYSLWTVTILLSSAALLRAMRLQTKLSWGLYALSLALGFYTFILSGLVAIAHGIYVFITKGFRCSKTAIAFGFACFVAILAFLPWIFVVISNLSTARQTMAWMSEHFSRLVIAKAWIFHTFSCIFIDFWSANKYLSNSPFSYFSFGAVLSIPVLILIGYSFYFLWQKKYKENLLFLSLLIGIIVIFIVMPDLILGGRRSLIPRYLIPLHLGIQIAVSHLFASQIAVFSYKWQQKFWQIVLLTTISMGILSCTISSQAQAWWNKISSDRNPQIANIINQANHPLVISDSEIGYVMSLNYLFDKKVRLKLFSPDRKNKSKPLSLPKKNDLFLFESFYKFKIPQNSKDRLYNRLLKEQNYRLKLLDREGGLWQIKQY